jgi:hypothetical protein
LTSTYGCSPAMAATSTATVVRIKQPHLFSSSAASLT